MTHIKTVEDDRHTFKDSRIRQTHQDIGIRQKYTKTAEYDTHKPVQHSRIRQTQ